MKNQTIIFLLLALFSGHFASIAQAQTQSTPDFSIGKIIIISQTHRIDNPDGTTSYHPDTLEIESRKWDDGTSADQYYIQGNLPFDFNSVKGNGHYMVDGHYVPFTSRPTTLLNINPAFKTAEYVTTADVKQVYKTAEYHTAQDSIVSSSPIVMAVHDGDSYKIKSVVTEWVRIMGIDCPEVISNHIKANQAFGVAIGDSIRALIKGKPVTMKTYGKDRYHRTLAQVFVNGRDIAEIILEHGWAWYYTSDLDKDTRKKYQKLRDYAKKNKYGIWSVPNPVKPADFRRANWKD